MNKEHKRPRRDEIMDTNTDIRNMIDTKKAVKLGAAIVLILDVIFMLSAYVEMDALNKLINLASGHSSLLSWGSADVGDLADLLGLGNGEYSFFELVSLIRKVIVLASAGEAVAVSYLFAFIFWGLHTAAIIATVVGAVNLVTDRVDYGYTNGRAGVIMAFFVALITIIAGICFNMYIEGESEGFLSSLIGFKAAPFIVCIICIVYSVCIAPRLDTVESRSNDGKRAASAVQTGADSGRKSKLKCDYCGERMNDSFADFCSQCNAWRCEFCDTFNAMDSIYCTKCGCRKIESDRIAAQLIAESEDWVCELCGKDNTNESDFCFSCGTPKPNDEEKNGVVRWSCTSCGRENASEAAYCMFCGTKKEEKIQNWFCRNCGRENNAKGAFCGACGAAKE